MAFNRWTYYANKAARQAREYLEMARAEKLAGETYPGRIAHLVTMARMASREARTIRAANL